MKCNPLLAWLYPWLTRSAWQLLLIQWLLLFIIGMMLFWFFLRAGWQCCQQKLAEQQQLTSEITQLRQQLAQLPTWTYLQSQIANEEKILKANHQQSMALLPKQEHIFLQSWQRLEAAGQYSLQVLLVYDALLPWLGQLSDKYKIASLLITVPQLEEKLSVKIMLHQEGINE